MALTLKQRRMRDISIGVVALLLIVGATAGQGMLKFLLKPAGYLEQAPAGTYAAADWGELRKAVFEIGRKPVVEDSIAALAGKPVRVRGFLLPLHEPGQATQFYLAPNPGSCYKCSPPGPNEVIQINIAGGKRLGFTDRPVEAFGTLKLAMEADASQLYEMDGVELVLAK